MSCPQSPYAYGFLDIYMCVGIFLESNPLQGRRRREAGLPELLWLWTAERRGRSCEQSCHRWARKRCLYERACQCTLPTAARGVDIRRQSAHINGWRLVYLTRSSQSSSPLLSWWPRRTQLRRAATDRNSDSSIGLSAGRQRAPVVQKLSTSTRGGHFGACLELIDSSTKCIKIVEN